MESLNESVIGKIKQMLKANKVRKDLAKKQKEFENIKRFLNEVLSKMNTERELEFLIADIKMTLQDMEKYAAKVKEPEIKAECERECAWLKNVFLKKVEVKLESIKSTKSENVLFNESYFLKGNYDI